MAASFSALWKGGLARTCALALGLALIGGAAAAQQTIQGETYRPTIWIDPDGCEHWAMDDGAEGFMSPHRRKDGTPVCHRTEICGVMPTDQFFSTDSHRIHAAGRQRLAQFFQEANAFAYLIYGHTDSRASDEYNIRLSQRRANAVASVAQTTGARIVAVKGFGERQPRVANTSASNMAQNRRVEIYCLR